MSGNLKQTDKHAREKVADPPKQLEKKKMIRPKRRCAIASSQAIKRIFAEEPKSKERKKKRIPASARRFDKMTDETVVAYVYVSRVDSRLKFYVTEEEQVSDEEEGVYEEDYYTPIGMDKITRERLQKAVVEGRVKLEISSVSPREYRSYWKFKFRQEDLLKLSQEEAMKLHSFLKSLAPSKCREFFCQLSFSIEYLEMFVNDFGFTEIKGLWLFDTTDLERPVIKKLNSLSVLLPPKWFLSSEGRDFILNTKIPHVNVKWNVFQCTDHENFSLDVVDELLKSWLSGAPFLSRVFASKSRDIVEFPEFMKKRFKIVGEGEEIPNGGASCELFVRYDNIRYADKPPRRRLARYGYAFYKVARKDGAILELWHNYDETHARVVEMRCKS